MRAAAASRAYRHSVLLGRWAAVAQALLLKMNGLTNLDMFRHLAIEKIPYCHSRIRRFHVSEGEKNPRSCCVQIKSPMCCVVLENKQSELQAIGLGLHVLLVRLNLFT